MNDEAVALLREIREQQGVPFDAQTEALRAQAEARALQRDHAALYQPQSGRAERIDERMESIQRRAGKVICGFA